MSDLSTKKCVPCNTKDLRPMAEEAAYNLIPQVQGWNLVTEDGIVKLQRSWKVKTFMNGLEFFKLVADVAEAKVHMVLTLEGHIRGGILKEKSASSLFLLESQPAYVLHFFSSAFLRDSSYI
ncbi:hypothetical protein ACH5RR_018332 [Cinchona calisaya]|uniref:4a-hydroxytetrahydrobiopterin dehydratase n=1 Tax=Cinchona calisaya TaxID=153742 RepID=A0ABD2ZLL0_9GENT